MFVGEYRYPVSFVELFVELHLFFLWCGVLRMCVIFLVVWCAADVCHFLWCGVLQMCVLHYMYGRCSLAENTFF